MLNGNEPKEVNDGQAESHLGYTSWCFTGTAGCTDTWTKYQSCAGISEAAAAQRAHRTKGPVTELLLVIILILVILAVAGGLTVNSLLWLLLIIALILLLFNFAGHRGV